jgi:hypothetical protein
MLRRKCNNSTHTLLSQVYPEYDWLPWLFVKTQPNFWKDKKNQRKFTDWAAKQLNIKDMSDWYKVSQKVTMETMIELMR